MLDFHVPLSGSLQDCFINLADQTILNWLRIPPITHRTKYGSTHNVHHWSESTCLFSNLPTIMHKNPKGWRKWKLCHFKPSEIIQIKMVRILSKTMRVVADISCVTVMPVTKDYEMRMCGYQPKIILGSDKG